MEVTLGHMNKRGCESQKQVAGIGIQEQQCNKVRRNPTNFLLVTWASILWMVGAFVGSAKEWL